jgi:hypothetical protein
MPLNQIKKYAELLDLNSYSVTQRKSCLREIYDRDIIPATKIIFRGKPLNPTPHEKTVDLDRHFFHLTTKTINEKTKERDYDNDRSRRLHWVKFHIEERKKEDILIFSVKEKNGNRTYIYNCKEFYVIVLEPLRNINEYYLLTAYLVKGKDKERNKFESKYKRKLDELL